MTTLRSMPVFDGHNDVLLRLMRRGGANPERAFLEGDNVGHLDLAAHAGRAALPAASSPSCAIRGRAGLDVDDADGAAAIRRSAAAAGCDLAEAQQVTLHMASLLLRIERASSGEVEVCRSAAPTSASAIERGALAAILHIEGAEAHRSGPAHARRALRGGPALDRPGLEPLEHFRPRRAVPLSLEPRHRAGPDRSRPRAGQGLQPAAAS